MCQAPPEPPLCAAGQLNINCGAAIFDALDKSEIVAYRKEDYQFKVLVKDRNKAAKQYPNAIVGPATIEEIMLFYVKGEMK